MLTEANVQSEALWHADIRKVYHEEVTSGAAVDLNTFGWFYREEAAVQALLRDSPCLQVCELDVTFDQPYEGTPWTGSVGPEAVNEIGGFFVARPLLLPDGVPGCDQLEVTHRTNPDWRKYVRHDQQAARIPHPSLSLSLSLSPRLLTLAHARVPSYLKISRRVPLVLSQRRDWNLLVLPHARLGHLLKLQRTAQE